MAFGQPALGLAKPVFGCADGGVTQQRHRGSETMANWYPHPAAQLALVKARGYMQFICLFILRNCLDENLMFSVQLSRTVALEVHNLCGS